MAYKGKRTCKILKDIRKQIAEENDIDLVIKECTYQGDCLGTCPRCEAEVAYLERELARREAMGKTVKIAGMAAASFALASCSLIPQKKAPLAGDVAIEGDGEEFVWMGEEAAPVDTDWMAGGKRLDPEMVNPTEKKCTSKKDDVTTEIIDYTGDVEIVTEGMVSEWPVEGEAGPVDENYVYPIAEVMPEFPGGSSAMLEYFAEKAIWPEELSVSADWNPKRAVLQFVVDTDGSIYDVEVVRSTGEPLLDKESARIIKEMPKWTPGRQNGVPVKVKYTVPITWKKPQSNE